MNDLAAIASAAPRVIRLSAEDNVVVASGRLAAGTAVPGEAVTARDDIPSGHKVATKAIPQGEAVRKYAQIIGFASRDIGPGEHVHTHNCAMAEFARDYGFSADTRPTEYVPVDCRASFLGYKRSNGRVGTRNYIGIVSTVNCSATVSRMIAARFDARALEAYPHIDGVTAFVHNAGCGMASTGEGFDTLQRTMWGYIRHPNLAGVLLIGLGCEANQVRFLTEAYGLQDGETFQSMTIQETGGTRKSVEEGVRRIEAMLTIANRARREHISAQELMLGLQCGGSDGYSGITANPALGSAADILVRHGGTAILAETPEIYGAEHLLTRRAISRKVGEKLIERIRWWENYTARNGGDMNNNPSPGNKAGGLTTILEKSLGAAAKGGTTNLVDVYKFAEPITAKGFVFMDSPGYDPVSTTGEVASGANIVCFTTGRGSVSGWKPAPCLKLATNTPMFERMKDDMDIDCGEMLSRGVSLEEMGQRIFDLMLKVASGEKTRSEELGFGDNEFTPWVIGATM